MAQDGAIRFDEDAVFISYSPEDIDWAEDELRPRLEKSGVKVITGEDFASGVTISLNRERAIVDTRRTIVVLSPEWVANSWNSFEADMLLHLDPKADKRKLLPVLLRKTEIPPRIARLTLRDLTNKKRYESRLAQLIRDIEDAVPVPPRDKLPRWWEWYWRQARRRGATPARVAFAGAALLLILLALLQVWPFQPRDVWMEDAVAPRVAVMHASATGVVAGAFQNLDACPPPEAPDQGLWYRALAGGSRWQESQISPQLLCQPDKPDLSNINALSSHLDAPPLVYALTSQNGLVMSRDGGRSFGPFDPPPPRFSAATQPLRLAVGGSGEQPILWISGKDWGLWRLAGDEWERIDRGANPACPMPENMKIRALLAQEDWLLAGSAQQGLWRVEADACQRLDAPGEGELMVFYFLRAIPSSYPRYLAVIFMPDPRPGDSLGRYRLTILCPQPSDCAEPGSWQPKDVLWDGGSVDDLLVREYGSGLFEWYLASRQGEIWRGNLRGEKPVPYPRITRCAFQCYASLAWLPDGGLYVLVNRIPLLEDKPTTDGHFYLFDEGPWYLRLWP